MILISKVLFGSVAVATLAGSVVYADAVDAVRSLGVAMQWPGQGEAASGELQPAAAAGHGSVQAPHVPHVPHLPPQHCPGRCDLSVLLSHVR